MRRKNVNLTILMCTVVLAGLLIYIINSAFWTSSSVSAEDKPTVSSNINTSKLALGGTISLNSEEVNSLLKLYQPKTDEKASLQIESISSSLKDDKISLFVKVKYHGFKLLLSTSGKLEAGDTALYYYPDYFKLGKLTIPKSFAYKLLKTHVTINSKENRIELAKSILPVEIESLEIKDSHLQLKLGKINPNALNLIPSTEKQKSPTKAPGNTSPNNNSSGNKTQSPSASSNITLLSRTSTQLKKVYSATKTTKEKEIVQLIQNTVSKMQVDEDYDYSKDASNVLSKYGKLSTTERNDIKTAILNNMDLDTLITLKDTFGL